MRYDYLAEEVYMIGLYVLGGFVVAILGVVVGGVLTEKKKK